MITLAYIAGLILQALSDLASVLGLLGAITTTLNSIFPKVDHAAQENFAYEIQGYAQNIQAEVTNVTYGLSALQALIVALGSPQQAGVPVTLPTTPPTGYGGGDPDVIATHVWNYTSGLEPGTTFDQLEQAGKYALQSLAERRKAASDVKFSYTGPFYKAGDSQLPADQPTADIANIHADDTLETWLDRETIYGDWILDPGGSGLYNHTVVGNTDFVVWCDATQEDFARWKALLFPTGGDGDPPIWPGADHITLGTIATIEGSTSISATMDGVVVQLTGVPTDKAFFSYGTLVSFRNIGQIVFLNDDGYAESVQTLGLTHAFYVPRTMKKAAEVRWRVVGGVTGTIRPFSVV